MKFFSPAFEFFYQLIANVCKN